MPASEPSTEHAQKTQPVCQDLLLTARHASDPSIGPAADASAVADGRNVVF